VVDLTVTEPPIEEVIGRVFRGRSVMSSIIRKARVLLSSYYAYMLEYRAELFLWALSGSLPLVLMGVWIEAAQGGQFGLGPLDFARYSRFSSLGSPLSSG